MHATRSVRSQHGGLSARRYGDNGDDADVSLGGHAGRLQEEQRDVSRAEEAAVPVVVGDDLVDADAASPASDPEQRAALILATAEADAAQEERDREDPIIKDPKIRYHPLFSETP